MSLNEPCCKNSMLIPIKLGLYKYGRKTLNKIFTYCMFYYVIEVLL